MQVNTKTGSLKLTKREQQTLNDALQLVQVIEKHGFNEITGKADAAAEKLGELLEAMTPAA